MDSTTSAPEYPEKMEEGNISYGLPLSNLMRSQSFTPSMTMRETQELAPSARVWRMPPVMVPPLMTVPVMVTPLMLPPVMLGAESDTDAAICAPVMVPAAILSAVIAPAAILPAVTAPAARRSAVMVPGAIWPLVMLPT